MAGSTDRERSFIYTNSWNLVDVRVDSFCEWLMKFDNMWSTSELKSVTSLATVLPPAEQTTHQTRHHVLKRSYYFDLPIADCQIKSSRYSTSQTTYVASCRQHADRLSDEDNGVRGQAAENTAHTGLDGTKRFHQLTLVASDRLSTLEFMADLLHG